MIQGVVEIPLLLVALVHAQHAQHTRGLRSLALPGGRFLFPLILGGVKCSSPSCTFERCMWSLQEEKCELSAGFPSLIFISFWLFPLEQSCSMSSY